MIIHIKPDILEYVVKWALGSITMNKASGGDGIPAELFQILKDDAVKSAALNMPANMENSAVATRLELKIVAITEFSKFADILSAALLTASSFRI